MANGSGTIGEEPGTDQAEDDLCEVPRDPDRPTSGARASCRWNPQAASQCVRERAAGMAVDRHPEPELTWRVERWATFRWQYRCRHSLSFLNLSDRRYLDLCHGRFEARSDPTTASYPGIHWSPSQSELALSWRRPENLTKGQSLDHRKLDFGRIVLQPRMVRVLGR